VEQLSRCNAAVLKKVVLKYMTDSAPPPAKEDPLDGWQGPAFQLQSVQDVESATIQVILPLEGHKCGDICLELNML